MSEWPRFPVEHRRLWGHFKTSVQQCYQAPEFLLLSISHHYSSGADCRQGPLRQTVFCCILMCANQLNAGPSIHPRYCFSTADTHMLPSAGAPRHVWESREAPREVTSKERESNWICGWIEHFAVKFCGLFQSPVRIGGWAVCTFTGVPVRRSEAETSIYPSHDALLLSKCTRESVDLWGLVGPVGI